MRRRRHLFSASLVVVSAALAPGCDRQAADRHPPPTHNPPPPPYEPPLPGVDGSVAATTGDGGVTGRPVDTGQVRFNGFICLQGPLGQESSVPCPADLVPEASPGAPVYQARSGECRTLGRKQVRCPPTIVLPDPRYRQVDGGQLALDEGSFDCKRYQDVRCPTGATCNPPAPEPVPCPDDLRPRLAAGVAPTSRIKDACFLGDVDVACPTGDLSGPAITEVPDPGQAGVTIRFRASSQDCWRTYPDECDPGVKCNPPPPELVPCPEPLLPTLVTGSKPTRKKDGTCWSGTTQVRC